MRVFVTGATGVIGRRAVPALQAAGHAVVAVARSAEKRAALETAGAEAVACDIFDFDSVAAAAADCDAFVNLATHIPPAERAIRRSAWSENDRIRREVSAIAARVAADEARSVPTQVLVQESIVMTYPDRGDAWIDETVPITPTSATASAEQAEQQVLGVARGGLRAVVLRFGLFSTPDGAHADYYSRMARRGVAAVLGKPDSYSSFVAIDDAARAVVAALDAPTGVYNVVGDRPLTRDEQVVLMATAAGRDRLIAFPGRLSVLFGDQRVGSIARSHRVSNLKFKEATGWSPSPAGQIETPAP